MIDIMFSREELYFRDQVRAFMKAQIEPEVEKFQQEKTYPRPLIEKIGKAGYNGALHDQAYGGTKKGAVYECIVAEEVGKIFPALDLSRLVSTVFFGMPLGKFGTAKQKETYLPGIVSGAKIGAIGITEPDVGSDAAGMKTKAVKQENHYVINGEKRFITNGSQADFILVFAITDPNVKSHKGMSAFIVEKGTPGFEAISDFKLMGMECARVSYLKFKDVKVPAENLLGSENKGFQILMDELDCERTTLAAEAVGYAQFPFDQALKFSNEREQFSQKIRMFEGVNFKIADMVTKLEASRLLVLLAARMIDSGNSATKEASMAKIFATESAVEVADLALQIQGGHGYTKDSMVERYYRDARLMRIGGGTGEIVRYLLQREVYKTYGL
ncbi:acyl-CoA dehydrogenase family protein [bacterium]|nr:acyl-CoA dehydrogenase family protein [bacterium]